MAFLDNPGVAGPFGALMDEYARAAEDLCRVVETIPGDEFTKERSSEDPDTVSYRSICRHCVNAAYGYSFMIREARKQDIHREHILPEDEPATPGDVRGLLENALKYGEETLDGLYDADDETVLGLSFKAHWGPTYDPEMILEHAIVHLLRHRRQIERWLAGTV